MIRLFLIAAAITAVPVAMRRPLSSSPSLSHCYLHTHIQVCSPEALSDHPTAGHHGCQMFIIVTTVVMAVQGFKSIEMKWSVK